MLDGWRAQMLARGLDVNTIKARGRLISRFVDFTNEYPWRRRPIDVDQFLAAQALVRVDNIAVHLGVVGLQTEGDSTDDCSTNSDGGLRWLSNAASASIGIFVV